MLSAKFCYSFTNSDMANIRCLSSTDRGRMVVADSNLVPGKEVITEKPYAYVLSNAKRGEFCDSCLSANSALQRCSGCKFIRYCSKSCQRDDWRRIHKRECPCLKRVLPKTPPDLARLLAQLLWMQGGDPGSHAPPPGDDPRGFPRTFDRLVSHHDAFSDARREHFECLLQVLKQYLASDALPDARILLKMFGAVLCNSFSICDNDLNGVGVGMYIRCSMFNHSCSANCMAVFDGTEISIRSITDIKEGEECTINYLDVVKLRAERAAELEERFHFTCHCTRCERDVADAKHCDTDSEKMIKTLKAAVEKVEELGKANDLASLIQVCGEVFHQTNKTSHSLAPHHPLMMKLRDSAFDACIEMEQWTKAALYGLENTVPYRHQYGPYHPSVGVHLLKVGKLLLYLERIPEARTYLRQAEAVLEVTHGQTHSLMSSVKELLACSR